jgi:hypothetical protein
MSTPDANAPSISSEPVSQSSSIDPNLKEAMRALFEELKADLVDEITKKIDKKFKKRLKKLKQQNEALALDMGIMREHGRRVAGLGEYRTPIRSETETSDDSHGAQSWKRRLATPRAG